RSSRFLGDRRIEGAGHMGCAGHAGRGGRRVLNRAESAVETVGAVRQTQRGAHSLGESCRRATGFLVLGCFHHKGHKGHKEDGGYRAAELRSLFACWRVFPWCPWCPLWLRRRQPTSHGPPPCRNNFVAQEPSVAASISATFRRRPSG